MFVDVFLNEELILTIMKNEFYNIIIKLYLIRKVN